MIASKPQMTQQEYILHIIQMDLYGYLRWHPAMNAEETVQYILRSQSRICEITTRFLDGGHVSKEKVEDCVKAYYRHHRKTVRPVTQPFPDRVSPEPWSFL